MGACLSNSNGEPDEAGDRPSGRSGRRSNTQAGQPGLYHKFF